MDSRIFAISLFLVVVLAGCSRTPPEEIPYKANLGTPFQLKIGEKATIESEKLTLSFLNVTQDSRCPSDPNIRCFWEGQIVVLVKMERNGKDFGEFELIDRAGHPEGSEKAIDGYYIRLIGVELPYPKTVDRKIDPSDYLAKFEVVSLE